MRNESKYFTTQKNNETIKNAARERKRKKITRRHTENNQMAIVSSSLLVITLNIVELNSTIKRLNGVSEWLKNKLNYRLFTTKDHETTMNNNTSLHEITCEK